MPKRKKKVRCFCKLSLYEMDRVIWWLTRPGGKGKCPVKYEKCQGCHSDDVASSQAFIQDVSKCSIVKWRKII